MLKYQGPTSKDLNVTVGVYLPTELYERLVEIANDKSNTGKTGWWSMSRLIREILADYVNHAK